MLARLIRRTLGSQIRRNMVLSGLANIISMAVGLVFYPIALHYLGFEVYGIWLAVSIVLTLSQLGGIGLAPAVTKRVAESIGLGDAREAEATVACGHAFTLPLGVVISLMVWFLNRPLISFFDLSVSSTQLALEAVPWVGFLSGYAVFAQISQAALAGVGRTDIVSALTAGGRFLFLLVAWSLMASDWGLYSLIAGSWLETAAVQLATILFLRRYAAMHAFRWSLVQRETARELITFGSGVLGLNAMQLLLTPLNRALLSRYAGIQSVPIFEIAWGSAFRIRSLLDAALRALQPDISRAYAAGNIARMAGLIRNSYRLIAGVGTPFYLALILAAPLILPLWLRDSFKPELTPCFRIVLIGSFLSLIAVPPHHHLLAIGRVRLTFVGYTLQSVSNALIALILAKLGHLDPLTICLSLLVGSAFSTAWFVYASRRLIMAVGLTPSAEVHHVGP